MKLTSTRKAFYFNLLYKLWCAFFASNFRTKGLPFCASDMILDQHGDKLTAFDKEFVERYNRVWDNVAHDRATKYELAWLIVCDTEGTQQKCTHSQLWILLNLSAGVDYPDNVRENEIRKHIHASINQKPGVGVLYRGKGYKNYKRRIRQFGCQCGAKWSNDEYADCVCEGEFTWTMKTEYHHEKATGKINY